MATQLLVGDDGITFNEVVGVIIRSAAPLIAENWRDLAMELGIPHFQVQKMIQSLLLNIEPFPDILHNILVQWRGRTGRQATLEALCESFRHINMIAISDVLMRHFATDSKPSDSESWMHIRFNAAKNENPNTSGSSENTQREKRHEVLLAESEIPYQNAQTTAFMAQQVGTTDIYYYPVKRRLGQGATSLVFQGYFGKVDTLAAIKEIKTKDSEIFYKELDTFKTLSDDQMGHHPNVVKLFQWTEHEGLLYLAMEQATCDLRNFLDPDNPVLNRQTMLKISLDAVNGLKFLHQKNILHRDIKPENILIFANNEDVLAKLGDFGTSRKMTSLTSTMSMSKGTEIWMSPEAIIALHNEEAFPNSKAMDIFCLGMTIYFTLSKGKHPFAKSKEYGCFPLMNIKEQEVEYIKLEEMDTHDYTTQLLDWMMQKIPIHRPNINEVAGHPIWNE